jgi:hypothetical protein
MRTMLLGFKTDVLTQTQVAQVRAAAPDMQVVVIDPCYQDKKFRSVQDTHLVIFRGLNELSCPVYSKFSS